MAVVQLHANAAENDFKQMIGRLLLFISPTSMNACIDALTVLTGSMLIGCVAFVYSTEENGGSATVAFANWGIRFTNRG
jgi:hypothetical protein